MDPHLVYDGPRPRSISADARAGCATCGSAHTGGDQVVLVGRVASLFGGDLFETRMFPIVPYFPPDDVDVDGDHWIESWTSCSRSTPAIVVPGHGEVTDAGLDP